MLEKSAFFETYQMESIFEKSDLSWEVLEKIYDDYVKREDEFLSGCTSLIAYIRDGLKVSLRSLQGRRKEPLHLIEKIIRKRGDERSAKYKNINIDNYREIVRDLIGIRILVLSKEEWEQVHEGLMKLFPTDQNKPIGMAEPPIAYTRYGDRDIYKEKIHREYTNKGYRSQHYVVKYQGMYGEIQVRTLAEEVFGEFDHRVKYPYRNNNKFLIRYTNSVSQLLNSVDEMISTCLQLQEAGWKTCETYYDGDTYIDWKKVSQKTDAARKSETLEEIDRTGQKQIEIKKYADRWILRKEC